MNPARQFKDMPPERQARIRELLTFEAKRIAADISAQSLVSKH